VPNNDAKSGDENDRQGKRDPPVAPEKQPNGGIGESARDTKQDREIRELDEWARRRERNTFRVAVLGVLIAVASVVVSTLQWTAMRAQLAEMKSTDADTHALAEAAQRQANAAQLAAVSNALQAAQVMKYANAATVAADAAKVSADNSARIASSGERGINTAQDAFRLEQRARIAVQGGRNGAYLGDALHPGVAKAYAGLWQPSIVHIDIALRNIGKTTATDVRLCSVVHYVNPRYTNSIYVKPRVFSEAINFDDDCAGMYAALHGWVTRDRARKLVATGDETHELLPVQLRRVDTIYPGEPLDVTMSWFGVRTGLSFTMDTSGFDNRDRKSVV